MRLLETAAIMAGNIFNNFASRGKENSRQKAKTKKMQGQKRKGMQCIADAWPGGACKISAEHASEGPLARGGEIKVLFFFKSSRSFFPDGLQDLALFFFSVSIPPTEQLAPTGVHTSAHSLLPPLFRQPLPGSRLAAPSLSFSTPCLKMWNVKTAFSQGLSGAGLDQALKAMVRRCPFMKLNPSVVAYAEGKFQPDSCWRVASRSRAMYKWCHPFFF
jgi:hypothetical protein